MFGESKPKILSIVDDLSWCYATTVKAMLPWLEKDFDIDIVTPAEHRHVDGEYALAWCRGALEVSKDVLDYHGLWKRALFTVTTDGEKLEKRIREDRPHARRAVGVVAQNGMIQERVEREWPDLPVWNIPNGVDLKRFAPSEGPRGFTVGFAGRMKSGHARRQKGFKYVQDACRAAEHTFVCCDRELNRIPHDEMHEFYNSVSIIMQPSHSEGCSNTIMEAMACGKVCLICKDIGYHGEVCKGDADAIADGTAQVIFVRRDTQHLHNWILRLKEDRGLRHMIGKNARKFAEEHSWDKIAEIYRKMLWEAVNIARFRERLPRVDPPPIPEPTARPRREPGKRISNMLLKRKQGKKKSRKNGRYDPWQKQVEQSRAGPEQEVAEV